MHLLDSSIVVVEYRATNRKGVGRWKEFQVPLFQREGLMLVEMELW